MKFRVTFKDPDGVHDSITEVINDQLKAMPQEHLEDGEIEQNLREKFEEDISKWVDYGEYITVEFDTDAGTATVVPA